MDTVTHSYTIKWIIVLGFALTPETNLPYFNDRADGAARLFIEDANKADSPIGIIFSGKGGVEGQPEYKYAHQKFLEMIKNYSTHLPEEMQVKVNNNQEEADLGLNDVTFLEEGHSMFTSENAVNSFYFILKDKLKQRVDNIEAQTTTDDAPVNLSYKVVTNTFHVARTKVLFLLVQCMLQEGLKNEGITLTTNFIIELTDDDVKTDSHDPLKRQKIENCEALWDGLLNIAHRAHQVYQNHLFFMHEFKAEADDISEAVNELSNYENTELKAKLSYVNASNLSIAQR